MSNYTKATDFAAKDTLITGNPDKVVQGTEIDDEFNSIATAVNSKADDGVTFTAGTGLTGGGDISANRTVALDTTNTRNTDHASVSVTAGDGLTGGGTLEATRDLAVGAGTGVSVAADAVGLDTTHERNVDHSAVSITAGDGLTGGGTLESTRNVAVGEGTGITVNADDIELDTTYTDDRYLSRNADSNVVTGTTDALASTDEGTDIVYTSATAVTVTLPGTLAVGFQCTVTQAGAGTVTFTSSDTLNGGSADIEINSQWSGATLHQYSEGLWAIIGDVS